MSALLVAGPAAGAGPVDDDEPLFAPQIELRDTAPHELIEAPGSTAPVWLSLSAGAAFLKNGERSLEASLLLTIPLERFANRRSNVPDRAMITEGPAPTLKPPPRRPAPAPDVAPPAPEKEGGRTESPTESAERAEPVKLPASVIITPAIARSAIQAALRHARLNDATARVAALATRARSSALLPELRLRASRLVDEAQQLSPTEYDPGRVTASGGTSMWLEARGTWRLDRLLFADEEIALERMRHDRAEAQAKLVERVLDLLFAWQRALAVQATLEAQGAGADLEARMTAMLKVAEAEATLDVLTGGWFGRFRPAPATAPGDR